jgi:hypothetical protein
MKSGGIVEEEGRLAGLEIPGYTGPKPWKMRVILS